MPRPERSRMGLVQKTSNTHAKTRVQNKIMATSTTMPILTAANTAPNAKSIQVTERALKRVRSAMVKEGVTPETGGLRLGVQGGGCSGLSYNIRFDSQPRERDRVFEFDGV